MSAWKALSSEEELDLIREKSFSRPQLIFKHSTRCGISHGAQSRLQDGLTELETHMDLHLLDLLNYRSVSNQVASEFQIPHQSPQILLIREGKSVFNLSHYAIQAGTILDRLSNI